MKAVHVALVVVVSLAAAFVTMNFLPSGGGQIAKKETAYERVMRTGTLRCGYLLYSVFIQRDPNTGTISGIYYDIMEEIGRQLSLKIEWTEEIGTSDSYQGLKAGRFDVVCTPFTPTAGRARVTVFTAPTAFRPYYIYARTDDARFDNDYEKINDPSVKVSFVEGQLAQVVKEHDFPKATSVILPSFTDITQNELQVATRKADVAFSDPVTAELFIEKNPGKVKRVPGPPLRMVPAPLSVGVGEEELKSLLNTTLEVLQGTGFIRKAYAKYTKMSDFFFFPAKPWQE